MGKLDKAGKMFLGREEIVADLLNYYLHKGKPVISPKDVRESDPGERQRLSTRGDKTLGWVERLRDIAKFVVTRDCEGVRVVIMGIEVQGRVDSGMPVRGMEYEAMRYSSQLRRLVEANRRATAAAKEGEPSPGSGRILTPDEWPSGLKPDDRPLPVFTLVFYCGPGRWTGPRSLHELLGLKDPRLKALVADYRLNIVEPAAMAPRDFRKFRTDLRIALNYLAVQDDEAALTKLLATEGRRRRSRHVSKEAFEFIKAATKLELKARREKDGGIDMCKAQQEMLRHARLEGMEQGIEKGIEKGIMGTIGILRQLGKGADFIRQVLVETYALDAKQADGYMAKAMSAV